MAIAGKDSPVRKWLQRHREYFGSHDGYPGEALRQYLYDHIKSGRTVAFLTPHGQVRAGRAVMRGPAGWVLNCGGEHGTPGVADAQNTVYVSGVVLP